MNRPQHTRLQLWAPLVVAVTLTSCGILRDVDSITADDTGARDDPTVGDDVGTDASTDDAGDDDPGTCEPGFEGPSCAPIPHLVADVVTTSYLLPVDSKSETVVLPQTFDALRTVPFVTARAVTTSGDPADVLSHVRLTSPTTMEVSRNEPVATVAGEVDLVVFGPGASVQRIDYELNGGTRLELPLDSPVDVDRAFVVFTHEVNVMSENDSDQRAVHERIELREDGVVVRRSLETSESSGTIHVIEATSGHFRVQHITLPEIVSGSPCTRSEIERVDRERTFVMHSASFEDDDVNLDGEQTHAACYLVNAEELECCRGPRDPSSTLTPAVQVIEFAEWTDATVESALITMTGQQKIAEVDLSRIEPFTIVWGGTNGHPGAIPGSNLSGMEYGALFVSFVNDANSLVARREIGAGEPTVFPWYAITWPTD